MVKKGNIVQYRERLDKSLALPDLTDEQILKTLVKSQLQGSSKVEIEGCNEKLVETKTKEIYDFLSMLRSASGDNSAGSSTSRSDWKLKQDTEDFRVMYREGPEGTPFHTLLVEGYVDGPLDLSLCLSWESFLYKKWWPQFTIPSFKVLVSERLQRVQIGEHISLVRMKVPWPLSTREAIVRYYLFEYFQDDLVVVLLNTVSESTSIDNFNMNAIPEAKDVVRIDLLGGYAMQKVSSERSYFRIIGNLDIKLDFVPPSLINFISRQLIGSGFRLYQKAVASMMSNDKDKDISKALEDPLYVRIREALVTGEELKQDARFVQAEELIQSEKNGVKEKDISCEYISNQRAGGEEDVEAGCKEIVQVEEDVNKVLEVPIEEGDSLSVLINGKENGEIEGADSEEIVDIEGADSEEIVEIEKEMNKVGGIPTEKDGARSVLKDKRNGYVRSDVRRALETIERVISTVKEHGFHPRMPTSNSDEQKFQMEKVGTVDSSSAKPIQVCLKDDDSVKESSSNIREETSEEPATIQSFRQIETNPNLKELNHKKVAPASPELNLSRSMEVNPIDSSSLKSGTIVEQTVSDNKPLNNYAEDMKKSTKEMRYRYCCFMN
ncbi:uncharacterized protein LOC114193313 isoform X2 [Vigna unguiculata]|nr:uncharacterized protein LOC114193313 isoform X2 [Vigna unguiculata]XP_027938871.1 uncharacterized protein LOC114193313 isoform X2 [Vigna unguiculata]XP_027938879.1 uncharacterized protein LOC114193313 isoform X2 [Vigna unguiculata]